MEICPLCFAEKDLRRVEGFGGKIRICRGCGFQVNRIVNFVKLQGDIAESYEEVVEGESEGDLEADVEAFNTALKAKTTTRAAKKAKEA